MKWLETDKLIKVNKNIRWKECIGLCLKFIYEDIEGEVEIIDYKDYIVYFKIGDRNGSLRKDQFLKVGFGKVLQRITNEFKFKIGDKIKDNKRDITIIESYRKGSKQYKYYKYVCNIDGYIGEIQESHLIKGQGCSICANNKVVKGINDIATTDKWMIKYFLNKEDCYLYSRKSNKKIEMKCPHCGAVKKCSINNLNRTHSIGCICSDGFSTPEKFLYYLLKYLKVDFITQLNKSTFKWCGKYKYDFYIPSLNIIIETHGIQHYKETNRGRSLKEEQENDRIKKELALDNNIDKYIVIDCRYSDVNWLKDNVVKSLSTYFNLINIDWNIIFEKTYSNIIKEVCYYYNKYNNNEEIYDEISSVFNICKDTIRKYLKIGNELNWCVYKKRGE